MSDHEPNPEHPDCLEAISMVFGSRWPIGDGEQLQLDLVDHGDSWQIREARHRASPDDEWRRARQSSDHGLVVDEPGLLRAVETWCERNGPTFGLCFEWGAEQRDSEFRQAGWTLLEVLEPPEA